jgi:hypothetical protein
MKLINWAIAITIVSIAAFTIIKLANTLPDALTTRYELIILSGDTFDMDVNVLITDDTAFAATYVRENLDSTVTGADFDCRGVTFSIRDGKPPIIWLPYKSPIAIINHELFHATVEVMNWASVPLNITTEEVYAYELQHLSQQLDNQININK